MKHIVGKCWIVIISTFCLLNSSCKSNDEEILLEPDLVLREIQTERENEPIVILEFSEDGRPISGTNRSYSFNTNKQLIEWVDDTGGWVLPTNYSYNNALLITYDYPVIGSSDGVSQVHTEFTYEGNSVTQTAFFGSEINYWMIYTFMSTDYKYLIKKEVFVAPSNVGNNQLFEYDYDADFNLISVNHLEEDSNTGDFELKYQIDIEYDEMKNPFHKYINHNPIVFWLLSLSFDSEYLSLVTAISPIVTRNCNHNITKISQVNVNSGTAFHWNFEYIYNADGYPTEKKRVDDNGDLIYTMTFSYY